MSADHRGRIEIEVDYDAPCATPEDELVRLAGVAIDAISTQPDVDEVRGLEHRITYSWEQRANTPASTPSEQTQNSEDTR